MKFGFLAPFQVFDRNFLNPQLIKGLCDGNFVTSLCRDGGIAVLRRARSLMTLCGFSGWLTGGRYRVLGLLSHARQEDGPLAQLFQQQSRLLADRENAAGDLSQVKAECLLAFEL